MSQTRYVFTLVALAVLAGSGVGAALGEIHRNAKTPAPPPQARLHTFETDSIQTFHVTRAIVKAPFTLERLSVTGHGGTAVIDWYCGSWSPLVNNATDAVALYIDGSEVAETVAGGQGGEHDARAGILRWVGPLGTGPHVVSVQLSSSTGPVALPLVVGGSPVQEGVDVTEHARY
jgi:hypothetical protein